MEKGDTGSIHQVELGTALTEVAMTATIHDSKLQQAAMEGAADEHDLSIADAIKAYPQAIMWALVSSTCVIMEGYDTNLLSNFFAYRKYKESGSSRTYY
jgi:SP family general alpha glucoside:H+ symporter-like MFS transporter